MVFSLSESNFDCHGIVVKHVDSQHRGCQCDSSTCRLKNAIGEEGNGKPPHEFHFLRKNSEPCLWFLLRLKSSMQHSFSDELYSGGGQSGFTVNKHF